MCECFGNMWVCVYMGVLVIFGCVLCGCFGNM